MFFDYVGDTLAQREHAGGKDSGEPDHRTTAQMTLTGKQASNPPVSAAAYAKQITSFMGYISLTNGNVANWGKYCKEENAILFSGRGIVLFWAGVERWMGQAMAA